MFIFNLLTCPYDAFCVLEHTSWHIWAFPHWCCTVLMVKTDSDLRVSCTTNVRNQFCELGRVGLSVLFSERNFRLISKAKSSVVKACIRGHQVIRVQVTLCMKLIWFYLKKTQNGMACFDAGLQKRPFVAIVAPNDWICNWFPPNPTIRFGIFGRPQDFHTCWWTFMYVVANLQS